MHLFVLEYFTNLDNLAPIIYKLASKNQKVYIRDPSNQVI